jgi:hypothetical protein
VQIEQTVMPGVHCFWQFPNAAVSAVIAFFSTEAALVPKKQSAALCIVLYPSVRMVSVIHPADAIF